MKVLFYSTLAWVLLGPLELVLGVNLRHAVVLLACFSVLWAVHWTTTAFWGGFLRGMREAREQEVSKGS